MGDDIANGGVYKFVSDHAYIPGDDANNSRILSEGTLYIARWEPEGRRRFSDSAGANQITAANGTGHWVEVTDDQLVDTNVRIRAAVGATEFTDHYATNRPEDLEVDEDGSVFIALTNNSGVNDRHGSVRRVIEHRNDPEAAGDTKPFIWEEYAAGGPTGRADEGEQGFSSPDNLVFDKGGNVWVVTDISSTSLNSAQRPLLPVPRQQRAVHGAADRAERRCRVPLREHAGGLGGHRAVLHARRADPVRGRPAPRRGLRRAAGGGELDVVLAAQLQDGGRPDRRAAALARADHARAGRTRRTRGRR